MNKLFKNLFTNLSQVLTLTLALSGLTAFTANADIITTEITQESDSVFVDFYLNNANPNIAGFDFYFDFDFAGLEQNIDNAFDGFQPNSQLEDVAYIDGFADDFFEEFNLYGFFDSGWSDNANLDLLSVFLGRAEFSIIDAGYSSEFTLLTAEAWNDAGDDISPQGIQAQEIPEPSAMALFALGLLVMSRKRLKS